MDWKGKIDFEELPSVVGSDLLSKLEDEWSGLVEKTSLADADLILLEDSADSGAKKKVQISSLPGQELYDAVVASSGGDYTLPSAAFSAGAKSVFVRTGTYNETANVVVPDGGKLIGEDDVQINLGPGFEVNVDGNGGTVETTGTVAYTNGSSAVVGTGTVFTNLSPGDYIALGPLFYEISSITDNTNLTIVGIYRGSSQSGQVMIGTSMFTGCVVSNISLSGTLGVGLRIRGCTDTVVDRVTVTSCGVNISVADAGTVTFSRVNSYHSAGTGFTVVRGRSVSLTNCHLMNNVGAGVTITSDCDASKLTACCLSNNGAEGLTITGASRHTVILGSVATSNATKGLNTEPASGATTIDSCLVANNGTIGVDFDGDENLINNCVIKDNGSDGVWGGDDGMVTACHIEDNGGNGISLSGDINTIITSCNIHDNTLDGISVGATGNTGILIVSNRIYANGGNGVTIPSSVGANGCQLHGNLITGHTTDVSNANTTLVRSVESVGNPVRGNILYYDGSSWSRLAPGVSGQVFQTSGAGADPVWADGGNVFAAANIADNAIVRGDGGAKGLQGSAWVIDDSGNLSSSSGNLNGVKHYPSQATDPVSPAPSDGDRYYNTVLGEEMRYDGTRSKWLSVATLWDGGGRNGTTGGGVYYRRYNGMPFAVGAGSLVRKGTITGISFNCSNAVSHVLQVMVGGSVVATLASNGAFSASNYTVNADFDEGVFSLLNASGSSTTTNLQATVYYKLRV